jgi:hemerythrin-like domain-containing protein
MANKSQPDPAQDLVRIHRVITRGLSVGTEKCDKFLRQGFIDDEVRQGFATYIKSLLIVLDAHHRSEDEVVFPALKPILPDMPYDKLSSDHKQIELLLELMRSSIASGTEECGGIDLHKLLGELQQVSTLWAPHIAIEEQQVTKSTLEGRMSLAEQISLSIATSRHSQAHAIPPYLALPFVLYNLDATDRLAFAAPLPGFLKRVLIPILWRSKWAPMKPFLLA